MGWAAVSLLILSPVPGWDLEISNPIGPIVPWTLGEKFVFEIGYGMIKAGEATIELQNTVDLVLSSGTVRRTAYHIVASAHSSSVVDVFYKVRDRNEAWLDIEHWVSHRFEQHNQEGKYILDQVVEYDWKNGWFKNTEAVKGRDVKYEEGPLTIPAVDTLSSLFVARAKTLNVGEEFTMEVHSGKNWPLTVKVLRREKVKVPAGKFDCYVVEPFLRERGLFIQKGKKLQVWLTADARRISVKMTAEIFIGKVSAELKEVHGIPHN